MSICSIAGCGNELVPNTRLKTCAACRQSMHAWERRRPAEIVVRADRLTKYQHRLTTITDIKGDEVTFANHRDLVEQQIMFFKKPRPRNRRKKA